MKALLDYVSTVTDMRQEKKVLHKMMDITIYHEETVAEYIKVDRGRKQVFKFKKEKVCNRYESRKTFGSDYKFIKMY